MIGNRDNQSDEALAQQAARGNRAAFDEIVRRYTRPLIRFAAGRTSVFQDAEDIVQETFLRSYQHIGSFDGRYSLKTWLFTIAYRTAVSTYRKKRPAALSQEALECITDTPGEPSAADSGIWAEVGRLKPADHTVLWLRYKQDLDIEQIAAIMNKTQTGVRVHLHRARNRLARRIETRQASADACLCRTNGELSMERAK